MIWEETAEEKIIVKVESGHDNIGQAVKLHADNSRHIL